MCEKKELSFSIFMIYSLADKWKMSPAKVYKILNTTGILDNYIIKCYDVLHTQGKEYLVEDISPLGVWPHEIWTSTAASGSTHRAFTADKEGYKQLNINYKII